MTQEDYFLLEDDSYSSLKVFADSRKKYYKKYIEKQDVEEEETPSLTKGSLLDTIIFSPDEFDKRFVMTTAIKPTGQMGQFVDALWEEAKKYLDEEGNITKDFEGLMKEAYNKVKFNYKGEEVAFKRKKLETVILEFNTDEGGILYFNQLKKAEGKSVVDVFMVNNAEKTHKDLKTSRNTMDIMNQKSDKNYDVYNQLVILFTFNGYPLKSMLDKVIVDHIKKEIRLYDLKTCWDNEAEFQHNYLKYRYYLQLAVYQMAALTWAKKEGWEGYRIIPIQFVVADTANTQAPLVYETDARNLLEGLDGFYLSGKKYKGLNQIVEELKWHKETKIWDISKENYDNNGRVKIRPFTEK